MELEQKGKFGVTHIFEANMGNRTIETIRDYQGKRTGPKYASEITKAKCGAGDTPIGIAIADYDHEGPIPKTPGTWGSYTNNAFVRVETFGKVIKTVKLEAANSKIDAGDPIKVGTTTAGCYDKGTSSNNAIALEGAAANSGALIKVLFAVTAI